MRALEASVSEEINLLEILLFVIVLAVSKSLGWGSEPSCMVTVMYIYSKKTDSCLLWTTCTPYRDPANAAARAWQCLLSELLCALHFPS